MDHSNWYMVEDIKGSNVLLADCRETLGVGFRQIKDWHTTFFHVNKWHSLSKVEKSCCTCLMSFVWCWTTGFCLTSSCHGVQWATGRSWRCWKWHVTTVHPQGNGKSPTQITGFVGWALCFCWYSCGINARVWVGLKVENVQNLLPCCCKPFTSIANHGVFLGPVLVSNPTVWVFFELTTVTLRRTGPSFCHWLKARYFNGQVLRGIMASWHRMKTQASTRPRWSSARQPWKQNRRSFLPLCRSLVMNSVLSIFWNQLSHLSPSHSMALRQAVSRRTVRSSWVFQGCTDEPGTGWPIPTRWQHVCFCRMRMLWAMASMFALHLYPHSSPPRHGCAWYKLWMDKTRLAEQAGCDLIVVKQQGGHLGNSQLGEVKFLMTCGFLYSEMEISDWILLNIPNLKEPKKTQKRALVSLRHDADIQKCRLEREMAQKQVTEMKADQAWIKSPPRWRSGP